MAEAVGRTVVDDDANLATPGEGFSYRLHRLRRRDGVCAAEVKTHRAAHLSRALDVVFHPGAVPRDGAVDRAVRGGEQRIGAAKADPENDDRLATRKTAHPID